MDSYNEIYMIKAEYSDDSEDLYNNAGTFTCHSDEGFGWGGLSMIYGTNPGNNNHVVIISNDDEDDDYYYVANGKKINTKDFGGTFYNYVANVYLDEDNQKLKIYDDNFELSKEIELTETQSEARLKVYGDYIYLVYDKGCDILNKQGESVGSISNEYSISYTKIVENNFSEPLIIAEDSNGNECLFSVKGELKFSCKDDEKIGFTTKTNKYFYVESKDTYIIYDTKTFNKVSDTVYTVSNNNYFKNDDKVTFFITSDGQLYDLGSEVKFNGGKEIECAYGYELLYGEEDKTYSIYDMISKKVLYEFEGDNCIMGDSVPYIKMDKKYYDFNGKLIVDLEELNKK